MSTSNTSPNADPSKKEPKVIVLSMKDGKTFSYDFSTHMLKNVVKTTNTSTPAAAITKQPSTPSPSSSPVTGKFQNVVVQSIKKTTSTFPQTSNNILIRAQSPNAATSKKLVQTSSQVQSQLSPILGQKITSEIVNITNLKAQSPTSGNAVILNPLVKNASSILGVTASTSAKKYTQQPPSGAQFAKIQLVQISQNPSITTTTPQVVRKIISKAPMPILPKPEMPKTVQQQQSVILSQAIIQQSPQIKPNVIAIPVAYSKTSPQQQKWQTSSSSQPPALSPIQRPFIKQSYSNQSLKKMDNVKIVVEIEEKTSSEDNEEENIDKEKGNEYEEEKIKDGEIEIVDKVQTNSEDNQQYLNVKHIIEGNGEMKNFMENKSSNNNNNNNGDNEVKSKVIELAENEKIIKVASDSNNHNSDTLLLCDEQIASVSPEESPESIGEKCKDMTPIHSNESVTIKTVNEVKKNLKLDLIAATIHDTNSVNNKKKIEMEDDNESVSSDDRSTQSSMLDQKLNKVNSQEMQTNVETGGNVEVKKPKRSRKPKNPTIITSLGLPYRPPQPSNRRKKVEKKIELELDFHDPIYKIMWEDGIGGLNNCNKLFGFNEFGLVEVLDDKDAPRSNNNENEKTFTDENNSSVKYLRKINDPKDQYTCEVCSKFGTIRDFFSPECCSEACFAITKRRSSESVNMNSNSKDDLDSGFNTPVDSKKVMYEGEMISISQLYQRIFENCLPGQKRTNGKKNNKCALNISDMHFTWDSYLTPKSVPAPQSLFKTNVALLKSSNQFKVGMKLEAIDPKNQHLFCICSVEEKLGARMKLRFDGYSSVYNFWVNIDSPNIFPIGFCQSTGRKLTVPPRWINRDFEWSEYLDETNSVGASRSMFPRSQLATVIDPLKIGMKLEAEHCDNWYAGTIIDNFDKRVLIKFDGKFENLGCIWYEIDSPYLNYCGAYKELFDPTIFLPPTGTLNNFDWDSYLKENNAVSAPKDFFKSKTRKPNAFESGMKLEVVDPSCKQLIRPATIVCREEYKIQVIFDGFDITYAFWLDDDSEDIFPINYCRETDHPIEMPAGWNKTNDNGLCTIAGCRGIGNGVYADRYFHDNPKECPYKMENWKRLLENSENNRLEHRSSLKRGRAAGIPQRFSNNNIEKTRQNNSKKMKIEKVQPSPIVSSHDETSNEASSVVKVPAKRGRKRKTVQVPLIDDKEEIQIEPEEVKKEENDEIRTAKMRIMEPFLSDYGPQTNYLFNLWTNNSKILNKANITGNDLTKNPLKWNIEDVCTFVVKFCDEETTAKFYAEKIDGEALLSLCQKDLIDLMKIKVGPAIKIYNRILFLRQEVVTKFSEL
ncbi:hypothetical protein PVAND_008334 [Polypedilum vanderplanki]|uniref:SAM domain-containing protein n=1 Tax=Polypedilum vanderplanki TaxID=319348 RepID=A0A9J6CA96_POLVA|nr:hypothetical protein PVAND_008334 [Polypedilum vanderplanki]